VSMLERSLNFIRPLLLKFFFFLVLHLYHSHCRRSAKNEARENHATHYCKPGVCPWKGTVSLGTLTCQAAREHCSLQAVLCRSNK
jgi:hypothetical protein